MRARRRVIGTRRSLRAPDATAGAAAAGAAAGAASTSDFVTAPPSPVPATFETSVPVSAAARRAAGPLLAEDAGAAGAASGFAGAGAAAAFAAAGAGAAATAPASMMASSWSLVTVVPAATLISFSMPATGAGTSSTTLSVSRSARFSSRATASPAFLCQFTSVASATDSGSFGTFISVLMKTRASGRSGALAQGRRSSSRGSIGSGARCRVTRRGTQRGIDQFALLGFVDLSDAGGRCRRMAASGIQQGMAVLLQTAFQAMPDRVPGALVLRLFLAPDDFARLRIAAQHGLVGLTGEGIQLLDAYQRNFSQRGGAACLQQIEIYLAAAEHHTVNLCRRQVIGFVEHLRKTAVGKVFQR